MQNEFIEQIIENINKEMQKAFSIENISAMLFADSPYIQEALSTHILFPCTNIMRRGGKRLRPLLLLLFTEMLSGDKNAAYLFSPTIEGIHTASLIHDDIEDCSLMRRGDKSVHIKYGVDVALNAASALYFFAINLIEKQKPLFKEALYKECIASLSSLHLGQAMDIKYHSNYTLPFNYTTYEKTASLKTGTLFSLTMKASLIFSNKTDENGEASKALNQLGIAFQMFDDLTNISSGNKGKDRGDDIVEGKLSFPIVLYLEKEETNKRQILKLFEKAKKEGITSDAVSDCCTLLEKSGVLEEGASIAREKLEYVFTTLESIFGASQELSCLQRLFQF